MNDPENDHLLYLKAKRATVDNQERFRLKGLDFAAIFRNKDYAYINYAKLKASYRLRLLMLRVKKPHLIQGPLPLTDAQIRGNEVYKSILQREDPIKLYEEDEEFSEKSLLGKESINVGKVANFLQRVRNSNIAMSRSVRRRRLTTSSVVLETENISTAFIIDGEWLRRRRDLKPRVKERLPEALQVEECELLVQVVGAKNVPLRSVFDADGNIPGFTRMDRNSPQKRALTTAMTTSAAGPSSPGRLSFGSSAALAALTLPPLGNLTGNNPNSAEETAPLIREEISSAALALDERKLREKRRVRSFVEVRFQEHTIATATLDGSMPLWKQSISIPFHPPHNDFTPVALEQIREMIYFTVFDEVFEDDAARGGKSIAPLHPAPLRAP